jgi:hypothetical protein
MKTLLHYLEELEGKTIESISIEGEYSPEIAVTTKDDCVMILSVEHHYSRCGEYDGCTVEAQYESYLNYNQKAKYDLLTEEDILKEKNIIEKRRIEREKREAEEKRKTEEANLKIRNSELALLEQLKNKYEQK